MTQFKVGDMVRRRKGTGDCDQIKEGEIFPVQNTREVIYEGAFYIGERYGRSCCTCMKDWELVPESELSGKEPESPRKEITWDNFQAGDILGDILKDNVLGVTAKILVRINDIFLKSWWGNHYKAGEWHTIAEIEEFRWTFVQPESSQPPLQLTRAEIAEKFGVKEIIIKD